MSSLPIKAVVVPVWRRCGGSCGAPYLELGEVRIDYAWGGDVAITVNRLPHFGRIAPNLFFAQGFSGPGVALTNLAGKLIADAPPASAVRGLPGRPRQAVEHESAA